MGNKRICYICESEMQLVSTSVNAGWGDYKLTIEGVEAYECPTCGEKTFSSKEVKMLQELGKSLSGLPKDRPDILNLSETAELLRVSNQTIYNMIRDQKIKAFKVGREWRFNRSDIENYSREMMVLSL